MSIMYILIPVAAILTALGIYLFFWAVKTEQFDDLEKQGMSILFNEAKKENSDIEVTGDDSSSKNISEEGTTKNDVTQLSDNNTSKH